MGQNSKGKSVIKNIIYPWFICLLAAVFYSYDFLLRVTPSVMIHPLMAEYGVQATEIGLISAFYYYAYTPLQLPSGAVTDKFNPRWVLSLSALLCAFGALLFAMVPVLAIAYVARAMMGIGSAFAFVGALKLASMWLPNRYFALFSGITTALGTIGAMFTDTILSFFVADMGWQFTIYITSLIGFILTILLFLFVRSNPDHKVDIEHEQYYNWKSIFIRLFRLLKSIRFWINGFVGACLFLPVSVFASLWGVAFIAERYNISSAHAASMTSLIFLGMAFSGPFVGWYSDKIKSRRIPLLVGGFLVLLLSIVLIYLTFVPYIAVYPLLFLIGFSVGPQVLTFAVAREISPVGSTGLSTAATNFIVTMAAAVFQPLIGYILELSWDGSITEMGTPYYSVENYRTAFSLFILFLFLSFVFTFFIPKTKCQRINII